MNTFHEVSPDVGSPRHEPYVTVLPELRRRGWAGPDDDERADLYPTGPLSSALLERYDTDAMVALYTTWELAPGGMCRCDEGPRLNKGGSLAAIRAAGGQVVLGAVLLDLDRLEHAPWESSAAADAALDQLAAKLDTSGGPLEGAGYYTTRAGMRIIFELSESITPEAYNRLAPTLASMVREQLQLGGMDLEVDLSKLTWNCLFRLPFAARDGAGSFEPRLVLDR